MGESLQLRASHHERYRPLHFGAFVMTVGSQSPSSVTEEPDVNTIPGEAGVDYPNYHDIPRTNFKCSGKIVGYYADVEARCQVWHYCSHEGLVESWLCPNGTVYSQEQRVCQWYYDVDCKLSPQFHDVNKDLYIIPERFTSTTTERQRN